ncbi:protein NRT1/ PTR FAMILY 6.3-like [Oryza brachyantha]|uniref:Major facilitator superfamily (MFS) profile domain-containing protein n=1 Tax=Oryza brachyantha TaxID=4533 RepID=J3N4S3_ORYBR|nr:protein NRT1/ PTR FAMILY 6.3-like [Oryza brachyantha]
MAMVLPETAAEGKALTDAWDYKGRPAGRAATGGWGCAAMILGAELFERMTTLGIAVNLVPYMTGTMHLGNAAAANTVTNFIGTSFMLCLLGGFIADTYLGRYLTIAVFAAVQATGVMILTISTAAPGLRPPACSDPKGESADCVVANGTQLGVLYLGLYLTALGTGGLKSSVSGFGSDQFDESDDGERKKMMRFFNWFYFFVSIGALLATTVLVYVQDNVGRRWGYGICAVGILVGLAVFLSGTRKYRFKKLVGSPLTQVAAVTAAAWSKRSLPLPSDPDMLYDVDDAAAAGQDIKGKQRLPHSKECRFLDHAAIIDGAAPAASGKWTLCTRTDVEEVKQVVRMLPIWATTIMFWTIHAQMTTFAVAQASIMDRRVVGSFLIPAGSLTVFLIGSILLTVPFYDRLVLPVARRLTGNPHGLTPLQRVFVGLFLSIAGMAAAALIERHRLASSSHGAVLTVFLLMPQFVLVGAGEAFTYMGQLDFFLRECPKGMKTMSTGLFLSTCAIGFFFSTLLVTIVHKITGHGPRGGWLADNLDHGRLDYFYWLLAVLSAINLCFFTLAAKGYVYKEKRLADAGIELADEETIAVGH